MYTMADQMNAWKRKYIERSLEDLQFLNELIFIKRMIDIKLENGSNVSLLIDREYELKMRLRSNRRTEFRILENIRNHEGLV